MKLMQKSNTHKKILNRLMGRCLSVCVAGVFCSVAYCAQPSLSCDAPVYDFGIEEDAKTVAHIFELRNTGDAPLAVSDVRVCCGGSASFTTNMIAAGDVAPLTLSLSLKGRSGAMEKAFYVMSNDPKQPVYRLALKGLVSAKVALSASSLFLKASSPEDVASEAVTVTPALGIPHPVSVSVDVPWLEATVAREGTISKVTVKARAYEERLGEDAVALPVALPKGISRGEARVHFPEGAPYPYIDIPVTLLVPQEITALPPDIMLPSNPSASVQRNLMLRSPSREFKVLEVRCPVPTWTAEVHSTDGKTWRIKLGDLQSGGIPERSEIVILTNHPECPEVVVPVHVED